MSKSDRIWNVMIVFAFAILILILTADQCETNKNIDDIIDILEIQSDRITINHKNIKETASLNIEFLRSVGKAHKNLEVE